MIYKKILLPDEVEELNLSFDNQIHINPISNLITGFRSYVDIDLTSHFITDRLFTVLNDYYPGMQLDRWGRFYNHQYGRVKPRILIMILNQIILF